MTFDRQGIQTTQSICTPSISPENMNLSFLLLNFQPKLHQNNFSKVVGLREGLILHQFH